MWRYVTPCSLTFNRNELRGSNRPACLQWIVIASYRTLKAWTHIQILPGKPSLSSEGDTLGSPMKTMAYKVASTATIMSAPPNFVAKSPRSLEHGSLGQRIRDIHHTGNVLTAEFAKHIGLGEAILRETFRDFGTRENSSWQLARS